MPTTWVHVKGLKDYNRAPNSCNGFITDNYCRNASEILYGSAEVDRGGGSQCRAVSVCGDYVDAGGGSNPCAHNAPVKATNRRYIHQHHGWAGLPPDGLGLECEWNNPTDGTLRTMSSDKRYTNATINNYQGTAMSIWDQLVWGIKVHNKNTEGQGYCHKIENLLKQVHSNGSTCFDLIEDKISTANAQRKGVEYCKKHPTANQCKCINISQPGGVTYCLQNPTLPGCSKVASTFNGIPEKARTQFSLQNQSTGCFNGTACAGSGFFLPDAVPAVCNNTITVCEQTIDIGDVTGGEVNIGQAMECGSEGDVDKDGNPIDDRPPPPASFEDFKTNPLAYFNPARVTSDKRAAAGTGGVTFLTSCMCCLLILLMILAFGGGGGRKAGARFKR
tara:strand:+ start:5307 stop:6476 length:1170 start_codon:yes stop_codon:yes gene_type:complete